jgi:hypothetical protein
MPLAGFELTISVFKWAKTFHALDRAATVTGSVSPHPKKKKLRPEDTALCKHAVSLSILVCNFGRPAQFWCNPREVDIVAECCVYITVRFNF